MSETHDTGLATLQPPGWPRPKGYANGMVGRGRLVVLAGQIGWDAQGAFAEGFAAQTGQALSNILAVLAEAGGGPEHIARLTWYVTDIAAYRAQAAALGPVWRAVMGRHFPAMSVVGVTALVEPAALVEIEATAILPD
ncbi:MAG: enamine deaminase RidA [Rhodospirillales bacterium 70-18]|nr:RidA family protein [Rhodospirillales bacterium]OJY65299.1 MAG: enamine deaminase RidA [Rhodospirillales bacterium 70-18]